LAARRGRDGACKPLAPSHADACNPLLQAHPTWPRDKHEGRRFPLYACLLVLSPPCSVSRRPIWAGTRDDSLLVGPGTPRGRNVDSERADNKCVTVRQAHDERQAHEARLHKRDIRKGEQGHDAITCRAVMDECRDRWVDEASPCDDGAMRRSRCRPPVDSEMARCGELGVGLWRTTTCAAARQGLQTRWRDGSNKWRGETPSARRQSRGEASVKRLRRRGSMLQRRDDTQLGDEERVRGWLRGEGERRGARRYNV
jgi:hypothetical protein